MFRTMWRAYKNQRAHTKLVAEKKKIAKGFNDRYTFVDRYDNNAPTLPGETLWGTTLRGGYAWMCPTCNKVHMAIRVTGFTGVEYPACCMYWEGHRLDDGIKTK